MTALEKFLKELAELTQKYNLEIVGCGCCGSPAVVDMSTGDDVLTCLSYDSEKQKYIGEDGE